jgi:hypothetical protein
MTDCPTCRRPVDGLVCTHCRPPIPPAAKAKIDAIIARQRTRPDREAELERAAIQGEAT